MPTTHTVVQGDTLTRIARQYKYGSWQALYNHPANAEFKKLRHNPNLIFPGDKIVIPDIEPKKMGVSTTNTHVFCVSKQKEMFRMKIQNGAGGALEGAKAVLEVGGQKLEAKLDESGLLEVALPEEYSQTGNLEIFLDEGSDEPTHIYEIQLGHLDPVDTLSGVQARLNALGYDCGVVDGIMGRNTREGVEAFQDEYGLDVDGIPGPITKAKLREVYGY